ARNVEAANSACLTIQSDVSERGAMEAAVGEAASQFGRLDILINNAGVMYLHEPGVTPRARWEKLLNINLLAVIEGCEAAIRHMRERDLDGRIVNVTSMASRLKGGGIYGVSKIGVEKYTDEIRNSLEGTSIRASMVVPGGFATNLGRDLSAEEREAYRSKLGDRLETASFDSDGRTPFFGVPDDVARAVLFALAQPTFLNVSEIVVRPAVNIDPGLKST
ncbi:MAG: SDR family oxidoreductase, partial [Pseudomonadota bacterium]